MITYAFYREFNDVSNNIDDKDLKPKLIRALADLRFVLGNVFYDQLISQWDSANEEESGFTADNLALYNPYIKEYLAKQMFVYHISRSAFDFTRTGLRVMTDEFSTPAAEKLFGELLADEKKQVQYYKGRIINYIRQQQKITSTKYPLYTDECVDKMGATFGITAVSRKEHTYSDINKQVNNGY